MRPGRPKRLTRGWRSTIDPQAIALLGAYYQKSQKPVRPVLRPASTPQELYTGKRRTLITAGYASVLVAANGTATAVVGPQGVGTVWYPQQWAIATTSGAADTSTCTVYHGPLGLQTLIIGQSYAGGGDSGGMAVPPMFPGYFVVAVWAGAKSGDLASLTVYGQMDALVTGR